MTRTRDPVAGSASLPADLVERLAASEANLARKAVARRHPGPDRRRRGAAYLESTNPANNARYESVGFQVTGGFEGYTPGSVITTMWRPARH